MFQLDAISKMISCWSFRTSVMVCVKKCCCPFLMYAQSNLTCRELAFWNSLWQDWRTHNRLDDLSYTRQATSNILILKISNSTSSGANLSSLSKSFTVTFPFPSPFNFQIFSFCVLIRDTNSLIDQLKMLCRIYNHLQAWEPSLD